MKLEFRNHFVQETTDNILIKLIIGSTSPFLPTNILFQKVYKDVQKRVQNGDIGRP